MALASKMNAAMSAALAHDRLGERLSLDSHRLEGRPAGGIGGSRQACHQAGFEQVALEVVPGDAFRERGWGGCLRSRSKASATNSSSLA